MLCHRAKQLWTSIRTEMFALIQAIRRVHATFMHGFPFIAETDHFNTVFTDHLASPELILRKGRAVREHCWYQ